MVQKNPQQEEQILRFGKNAVTQHGKNLRDAGVLLAGETPRKKNPENVVAAEEARLKDDAKPIVLDGEQKPAADDPKVAPQSFVLSQKVEKADENRPGRNSTQTMKEEVAETTRVRGPEVAAAVLLKAGMLGNKLLSKAEIGSQEHGKTLTNRVNDVGVGSDMPGNALAGHEEFNGFNQPESQQEQEHYVDRKKNLSALEEDINKWADVDPSEERDVERAVRQDEKEVEAEQGVNEQPDLPEAPADSKWNSILGDPIGQSKEEQPAQENAPEAAQQEGGAAMEAGGMVTPSPTPSHVSQLASRGNGGGRGR